jgi:hypothetical protein
MQRLQYAQNQHTNVAAFHKYMLVMVQLGQMSHLGTRNILLSSVLAAALACPHCPAFSAGAHLCIALLSRVLNNGSFTGEAVPQAPGSWVRPAESCVVSQYNCAPPVKPQKKEQWH